MTNNVVTWVLAHWRELLGVLYALANLVVAITPTPRDDEALRALLVRLSVLTPRDAEGTLKPPLARPRKRASDVEVSDD